MLLSFDPKVFTCPRVVVGHGGHPEHPELLTLVNLTKFENKLIVPFIWFSLGLLKKW